MRAFSILHQMLYYSNSEEESAVIIYNISGEVVKTFPKAHHKEITVSDLNSGIYLFEVTIQNKKSTTRIIVK